MRDNDVMTERRPAGMGAETWVDKQIRMAQERGDFDNLPGRGKPIPGLDKPYDELWWVKECIRREGLSTTALLPISLRLRAEVSRLPDTLGDLPNERAVREVVERLNGRIAEWLRAPSEPYVPVRPVDVDDMVARWRAARRTTAPAGRSVPTSAGTAEHRSRPTPWWRRIIGRRRNTPA
jgi:hypothetical protein